MIEYFQTFLLRFLMAGVIGVLYFFTFKHFEYGTVLHKNFKPMMCPSMVFGLLVLLASYLREFIWYFVIIIIILPYLYFKIVVRAKKIERLFMIHIGVIALVGIIVSLFINLLAI